MKENKGDLISREALKKAYFNAINETSIGEVSIIDIIDNAPTVEVTDYDTGYQDGLEDGLNDIRPQGEWITTRTMIHDAPLNCGARMGDSEK